MGRYAGTRREDKTIRIPEGYPAGGIWQKEEGKPSGLPPEISVTLLSGQMVLFLLLVRVDGCHVSYRLLDDELVLSQFRDLESAGENHIAHQGFIRQPDGFLESDLALFGVVSELGRLNVDIIEIKVSETALLGDCVREGEFAQSQIEVI